MRIIKTGHFEAAHMLSNYEGKCHNLHGHSYMWTVDLSGFIELESHMVMDFNDIKEVFEQYDHAIIFSGKDLRSLEEEELYTWASKHNMRFVEMPEGRKSTAEDIAEELTKVFRDKGFLGQVILAETRGSEIRDEI